ncbi:MAG: ATP-binding cassette domain-containing protein [Candidatus Omnitrophica bacterium]|nr:ATP-binding cassette domain-containing protein [Candidatus Omnitrophota bacterium]
MIELRDISKSFGGQELFENISFSIGSNEKIGLVGRNGHGKTTLFSLINGTLAADAGTIVIPKNYRIGYLKQDITFSQNTVINEVYQSMPRSEQDNTWIAEKVLHGLGFSNQDMLRAPEEFSGGFQVRINLAKILVSDVNLLLLDEPNNYLDVVAIRWLIRFLNQWSGELVLITHDRCFMDAVTTHILGIYRKKLRKIKGNTQRFYDQIAQEDEIHEKTRVKDERKRKQAEVFINKFRAKARQAGMAQSRIKSIAKMEKREKLEAIKTFNISFNAAEFGAANMMTVTNLSFAYDLNLPPLFKDISLRIGKRQRLCVVGKNGKGKSTLLRVLAGQLKPVTGTIKTHPKLEIGFYAQTNIAQLNSKRTILDELKSSDPDAAGQRVRSVCGSLLFSQDLALKPISVLSGGEKSRVMLGKILMKPAHLLLLDEPTNHLDLESSEALCEAIDNFDGSVVMVTHNELFLDRIAESLLIFDEQGVTFFDGNYQDFLSNIGWQDEEAGLKSQTQKIKSELPGIDRKTRKRLIAELRDDKSRILKPLEVQITDFENKISNLENRLKKVNDELLEAAYASDAQAIADLAKESKRLPAQIDEHYNDLDKIFQKYEILKQEFEQKIRDIEISE